MTSLSLEHTKIGIVGLGLIGGSLALDLQRLGYSVYGVTHREETADRAKQRKLAQVISTDTKILTNCSVIFLALPLQKIIRPESDLLHSINKDAVVTDVGSVKLPILETWQQLHPRFVASPPMAGNELAGVDAGQNNLFKEKPWIITPEPTTDATALKVIHQIASELGSQVITTEAALHDQAVALISHLPVFVSAALLKTVLNEKDQHILELTKKLSSSGFSDTTRVGGGNAELGISMAKNNKLNIIETISFYKQALENLEQIIIDGDWNELRKELNKTHKQRADFIK